MGMEKILKKIKDGIEILRWLKDSAARKIFLMGPGPKRPCPEARINTSL